MADRGDRERIGSSSANLPAVHKELEQSENDEAGVTSHKRAHILGQANYSNSKRVRVVVSTRTQA